jgi:hypothetical protein
VPVRGSAGHFALRLGKDEPPDLTLLAGASGGSIYAAVISEADESDPVTKKHLGPVRFGSFVLPVGIVLSSGLFEWLAASWSPQPTQRDGAVLVLDHQLSIKTQAAFSDSLITETTFPTLDAASKDAGHVTIRVQPGTIEYTPGAGKVSFVAQKQKLWRVANFRLLIDGLDCTHVSRIESFTVRRELGDVPGRVEFPNLVVTLTLASAETWYDWHQDFVVAGNNGEAFERGGALSFLAANLQSELTRIELRHLGIVRLLPAENQPNRVSAELYCEEMVLVQ